MVSLPQQLEWTHVSILDDCPRLPGFFLQLPYLLVSNPAFIGLQKEESHFRSAASPAKPAAVIRSSSVSEAEVKTLTMAVGVVCFFFLPFILPPSLPSEQGIPVLPSDANC